MRRGHTTVTLFILLATFVFGGEVFSQTKFEWRVFAPEGEEFATEAPAELLIPRNADAQPHFYKARVGQSYFFVYSSPDRDPYMDEEIEYIRRFQPSGKNEQYGDIVVERFSFDDGGGFHHEAMYFKTARSTYLFHLLSDTPNDNLIARFFAKLSIGKVNDSRFSIQPLAGIYDEVWRTDASSQMPGPTITQKPRAQYTDLARQGGIHGSIIMKVQFLADGTIGKVTRVKGLPFGLTEETIKAIRKILFQPTILNGKPIDSEKILEYSFVVY